MWVLVFIGAIVLMVVVAAAVRTKRGPRTTARPGSGTTSHDVAKTLGSHVDRGPW